MKHIYKLVIESDKPLYILDILKDIGRNICKDKDYNFYVSGDMELTEDEEIPF